MSPVGPAPWVSRAPLAAAALVALEGAAALAGEPQRLLAVLALVVAPGLAALPFLPPELRRLPVGVPVIPIVGVALSAVLLVSVSALGVPLDDVGIRSTLLVVVVAAAALSRVAGTPAAAGGARPRAALPALAGLAAVVAIGVALQSQVVGGEPLPGEDWGEYLLYAQQIELEHALLIDNPYWMLGGESFPLDPGAPAVYGAYLELADEPATALLHGIWLFAVFAVLAVFVFAATLWGSTAGLIAAGTYAVVPMNLNMLAWHGLPNVAALAVLPLALAAVGIALRGEGSRRWAAVLGLSLVALAAYHRFSFVLGSAAVATTLGIALWRAPRTTPRFVVWTGAACLAGVAVAIDLVRRNVALGGTQGYEAFLPTKVEWELVARDLTWPVALVGLAAGVVALTSRRIRTDPSRFTLVGLAVAIVSLTYAWIAHVPTAYNRAAFFAPLAAAAALGLAATRLRAALALVLGGALVAATAVSAHGLAGDYRGFYAHVDEASLRGLGIVNQRSKPGEALVTDQCWSFLSTWLLQRPVLAALDPALILPRREVEPAARARRILYGPDGARLARAAGVRFALVDPQCTYQTGVAFDTPRNGRLVYASTRLLVFDLSP